MAQNITEENLKLENDTLHAKREYKHALENLERVKSDTNDIISIRDKATRELNERNAEKLRVENDIASMKIAWLQEQSRALDDLSIKNSEADNVLKRKAELNKQEETIRQITAKDIEARDEARRLEFKNEQDKTALDVRESHIEGRKKELDTRESKMASDMKNFKERIIKVIQEVENI